jgi:GH15 family glucan-1,4-alpha-glucosidase
MRGWLRRAVAGNPDQVQIMYGLAGERRLDERKLPGLAGYEGAKPVRIGYAAAAQQQLDIYGEVMDALFQAGAKKLAPIQSDWDLQRALVEHLDTIWQEPDEGIWEVRGGRRHFTHSKVMAWVTVDRALKSIERFGVAGPFERWRELCHQIRREVCERGYNARGRVPCLQLLACRQSRPYGALQGGTDLVRPAVVVTQRSRTPRRAI